MNKLRRSLSGVALAAVVTGTCATAALAATETTYPSVGGTWYHGTTGAFGGGDVVSDYYHGSRSHSSSVKNCNGNTDRSGTKSPKVWANSSLSACQFATDYAYYNVI